MIHAASRPGSGREGRFLGSNGHDHKKWEPELFRFTPDAERVVFEVEFNTEGEASSFADAFGGRVLDPAPAMSNV